MRGKFPYELEREIYRPLIRTDFIQISGEPFRFRGLIDSGAPWCLFPGFIATLSGHKILRGKSRQMEIGGQKISAYLHKTQIRIAKNSFIWDIYYSHDIDDWNFGILGQEPFFSNFLVVFNYPKKEVILESFS